MEVYEHPGGRVVTLGRGERFVARCEDGTELRVRVVTSFVEDGWFSLAGHVVGDGEPFREVEAWWTDVGLSPSGVREALG